MIDSINADLNIFSPMRLENLDARAPCSQSLCNKLVSKSCPSFFPKMGDKMPLTKTKN